MERPQTDPDGTDSDRSLSERNATRSAARRQIPRAVWTLGFVSLLMDTSSEMIHALLPVYLIVGFGASALTVGLIEGVAEATASITKVFSGALSDWFGRRKALAAIGYGLSACTKPVFPLAGSVGWIIAARFADRVGKGIRGAPRDALVADIAPLELRGASFGLRQSLDTVGAFLGPLAAVGLMTLLANDFRSVFWIAVVPAVLALGLMVFGVEEPARSEAATRKVVPRATNLRHLGAPFWLIVGFSAVLTLARFSEAFLVLKAQDVGLTIAFIPMVMVVMSLCYALAAYPAGDLSDRVGRGGVLSVGIGFLVVADLILAFGSTVPLTFAGVALWGLHMGFTQGLLASLVADAAPQDLRGTAFGVFHLVTGVSVLVASLLAGALWDLYGPTATFVAGAAISACALVAFLPRRG